MSDFRYSEADANFDPSKLTPEQREAYENSAKAAQPGWEPDKETAHIMGADEIRARFKLEVRFGPKRTVSGPNVYMIKIFESGKRFHGGGDELAYWCMDVREGHNDGCGKVIIGDWMKNGMAYCHNCGAVINSEFLTSERFGKVPTKKLAEHLTDLWRNLDCNADIYCKYDQDDIRYKVMEEKLGAEEAHRLRGLFIYPLKNILKDTSNGASVESRFEAFLKA
jgi:hypothetical protein